MKAIILAAGRGRRLAPLTDSVPKCMVKFNGKPIIDYIIETFYSYGINNIVVIGGYKKDVFEKHLDGKLIKFYSNPEYQNTNMVTTLFCAEKEFEDDIIISYSDIIYSKSIVQKLIKDNSAISVVIDTKWMELWNIRMENPLDDAETLKLDSNNFIIEIGKKTKNYSDIQGQYIGIIKVRSDVWAKIIDYYYSLDRTALYDGKDFNNMYMTTFLQYIIDHLLPVKAILIEGGWMEIDSLNDIDAYQRNNLMID